jgi:hypothetical protein
MKLTPFVANSAAISFMSNYDIPNAIAARNSLIAALSREGNPKGAYTT